MVRSIKLPRNQVATNEALNGKMEASSMETSAVGATRLTPRRGLPIDLPFFHRLSLNGEKLQDNPYWIEKSNYSTKTERRQATRQKVRMKDGVRDSFRV